MNAYDLFSCQVNQATLAARILMKDLPSETSTVKGCDTGVAVGMLFVSTEAGREASLRISSKASA